MTPELAIVVPLHRDPPALARMALDRILQIAPDLDKIVVCHEGVARVAGFERVVLPRERFQNVATYNALCLSAELYEPFRHYGHVLIHQDDAFLFSADFAPFLAWDYVGAPWTVGVLGHPAGRVGNGGLSLRRVLSMLEACASAARQSWSSRFPEDVFFGVRAADAGILKVAPELVAARFSLEYAPREYVRKTGVFPVGCHGFWNQNVELMDFWRPIIERLGYKYPA